MQKFQQGGIYPVVPTGPDYDIPNSQGVALPPPINVSVKDMTHLAYLMQNGQSQAQLQAEKAALLKEQRAQALIKLKDPLFGDVDNPNQLNRLKELRKEYNVPETLPPGLLENPALMREYERSVYNLTSSDKYQKLRREIATARLYNDKSITDLDGDAAIAYGQAYSNYMQYGAKGELEPFDVENKLRPGIFETAVNNKRQADMNTALNSHRNDLIGYDLTTDAGKTGVTEQAAFAWAGKDQDGAIALGLIELDELGLPRATAKGTEIALRFAEGVQRSDRARRDLNAEYQTQQKLLADQIRDANVSSGSSGDSGGGKVTKADIDLAARLGLAKSTFEKTFPGQTITPEIQQYLDIVATNADNAAALIAGLNSLFSGNEQDPLAKAFKELIKKPAPTPPAGGPDYDPFFRTDVSPQPKPQGPITPPFDQR